MKNRLAPLAGFSIGAAFAIAGCGDMYGHLGTTSFLKVAITAGDTGTRDRLLPLTFDQSAPITIRVQATRADGSIDTAYNGFVRISVKPGTVVDLNGDGTDGRNVLLHGGVAEGVGVSVAGSFGPTYIWAEDIGYVPADPKRTPPPACSNGIDDNNNGDIDFPAERGCAFANDDTEDLGGYASGASPPIYFTSPRIADMRGVAQGGAATAFPHQQVTIDTGWNADKLAFDHSVIITRIASDGFYATDIDDPRGYSSVFAYNFSAPPQMRVCDRMKSFGGTASDFFGFTEMGFPTWELEEWDPLKRPCLVPTPHLFTAQELGRDDKAAYVTTTALTKNIAAMVRVMNNPDPSPSKNVDVHIGKHFGPDFPDVKGGLIPTDNATNCDFNHDGKIDFNTDPEKTCSANCAADLECSEYSNFLSQSAFVIYVAGGDPVTGSLITGSIQANGSASAQFDPVANRGKPIHSFTGTLRYFSGGTQYTIEARCEDDIVLDQNAPIIDTGRACVHARTSSDNSSASN
jgi:hypothetical protein